MVGKTELIAENGRLMSRLAELMVGMLWCLESYANPPRIGRDIPQHRMLFTTQQNS
jgi:hypothetical protein